MAKKMNNFLGHCCFTPFYPIVLLAKLRFLLNSDSPQRFVSIARNKVWGG